MNLSSNITLTDATRSATAERKGLTNLPGNEAMEALTILSEKILEPVLAKFGKKLISSMYRSPDLNRAIGGSKTSQHCKGEAVDLDGDPHGIPNHLIFNFILENLEFDQLIWEYGSDKNPAWVHVSYSAKHNRKRALRACRTKRNRTIYLPYNPHP